MSESFNKFGPMQSYPSLISDVKPEQSFSVRPLQCIIMQLMNDRAWLR